MVDISISVRKLVEFILRSGDISDGSSGTLSKEAMNAGSRIHRKLQKMAGSYYDAEVSLKHAVTREDICLVVEGRADGIIDQKSNKNADTDYMIDEIKGVYRKLDDIEEPETVHLAQAKCYAYIWALKNKLKDISVQVTYVNLESEEIKRFSELYTFGELEQWYTELMDKMFMWVKLALEHSKERNSSIENLEFPYSYRKGQKNMAACVYNTIKNGEHLFVQAPTGIGKTMAAIFPTVKSFATGLTEKLFYLTAKTIAKSVAVNAFAVLRDKGLYFKTVIITAKEKACPLDEMNCDPEKCPYAKGHYDRVNNALYEMVKNENVIDRDCVAGYAERYKVCPFELSLDASLFADGIICDYNYVFDPRVNLKRFFAKDDGQAGKYVFLVDEAHNLVDRASSMYSAVLIKEDFLEAKKIIKNYSVKTTRAIDRCNREFLALKRQLVGLDYMELASIGDLEFALMNLYSALETFLEDHRHIKERKEVMEFYFKINTFLNIRDLVDENYVIYDELLSDGRFMVKLYCIKPSANLSLCMSRGIATVFFSATILPVKYYKEMLSDSESDRAIYIPSPFDREKRRILLGRDVTTRYNRRNKNEYLHIFEYIRKIVDAHKGNYMVFVPSYNMLEKLYDITEEEGVGDYHVMTQSPAMTETEREEFLEEFDRRNDILAFCIMGGIFSEGIDLTGESLVGAVVVGPGLPQVCNERQIQMDFFDRNGRDGFRYTYQYPGINKVFQAAGRVIRTEKDMGVIALLDERFAYREYTELFPIEWNDHLTCNRGNVRRLLENFWDKYNRDNS